MSSQFKVKKVTKVKGLSDLSEKVSTSEIKKDSPSRGNRAGVERPQSRASSVKKNSSSRPTESDEAKSKMAAPSAPKPTTRMKQVAQKQRTTTSKPKIKMRELLCTVCEIKEPVICCAACEALYCDKCRVSFHQKTCPAQESGRSDNSSGHGGASKKETHSSKPVPRPRVSGASKSSTEKAEQPSSSCSKKKSKAATKETNNYNPSDSDSERGSSVALNFDGDFGYGSASFDDSDLSNNELLSPSSREENKDFVIQPGEGEGYSYAAVEFRPLIVTEGGGVAAPVETRHPGVLHLDGDSLQNNRSVDASCEDFGSACPGEQPLLFNNEGFHFNCEERKPPGTGNGDNPIIKNEVALRDARRKPLLQYEEVEIVDGEHDRSNVKFSALSDDNANNMPVNMSDDACYCDVPDEDNMLQSEPLPKESTCPLYISDTQNMQPNVEQIYAAVHKSPKQEHSAPPNEPCDLPQQEKTGSLPPAIPPRPFDTYEAITGELQNMIQACKDVDPQASLSEERVVSDGVPQRTVPPPIPKPYVGPGPFSGVAKETLEERFTHSEDEAQGSYPEDQEEQPVFKEDNNQGTSQARNTEPPTVDRLPIYAVVDKTMKSNLKQSASAEELRHLSTVAPDGEIPPPLPKRPVFEDTPKRAHSTEDLLQTGIEEKPKRSGLKFFKKKHRRQMSDGSLGHVAQDTNKIKKLEPSGYEEKHHHHRSKSQADITEHMAVSKAALDQQCYSEITIPSTEKPRSGSNEKPQIRAYLAVDIIGPPPTPTEITEEKNCPSSTGDLPEGWREVTGEEGTYYWHVASGTTQWDRPQVAPRPKKKTADDVKQDITTERQKVLSFPVHSMGWIELEENKVAPHNMSETISGCISILATKRNDLWNTSLTWGEGKDIRLLLEGDTLKLMDPKAKVTLLVQPVSKMRVWGVGKEDHRDFAYIARDPNTSWHKCHMFRCHGNISGRAITGALHEMCSKILEEKKRAQEVAKTKRAQQKPWSDILNTPPPSSVRDNVGFNEKPVKESKKSFSAKYAGSIDLSKPTGIDVLQKAISRVVSRGGNWSTVLLEITVSSIKVTDCVSQEIISDDRVRFMSFMGVGKDERLCGYIVNVAQDQFMCRVYQCLPNAATLTKAMEEACQLRYQKCIDAYPELVQKISSEQEKHKEKEKEKEKEKGKEREKEKDKGGFVTSMQGFLGKLGQKKGGKKDDESSVGGRTTGGHVIQPSHTFMVKYYGALPVAVGTGIETVEEAAKHLAGGTLLVCQLDVALNGVTLYDSQRSALSRRHFDADTISYCGLTSNRTHFGLIQSMGGGKYICHVFAEYKTKAGPIVAAIHETM